MENRKFLPVLWSRGLSDLFTKVVGGIMFHTHKLFMAWYSGCEPCFLVSGSPSDPETTIEYFAPYGKVVTLTFQDWDVLVIVTPWGPLEIHSLWTGGGKENETGDFTFPDGEVVPHDEMNMSTEDFILLWEKSYNKIYFENHHVNFELRG